MFEMYTQMELLVTIIIPRTRCLFPAITPNTFNLFDGDIVQAMGLLPEHAKLRLCVRGECGESVCVCVCVGGGGGGGGRFSRHQLQRTPLGCDPGMHEARAVMHVGNAKPRWRGKRSRHSRRIARHVILSICQGGDIAYCVAVRFVQLLQKYIYFNMLFMLSHSKSLFSVNFGSQHSK